MSSQKNQFPVLYHAHHQSYNEDLPFWQSLARWQGDPILELGCGTGRVLIPLAQDGHTVYGIDNSPDMLTFLRENVPGELATRLHIVETDMTNFQIDAQFRLILLPCNTYSTFPSKTRITMLTCVFQHLIPGGIFAVSMPNPTSLAALQTNEEPEIETIFSHPESGHPVQVSSTWMKKDNSLMFNWHYDHLIPDGQIERLTTTVQHHLDSVGDYITELITTGFTIKSTYRNFETGSYKPESSLLIILAQK
jgi:SAM-dependent methyltransferase